MIHWRSTTSNNTAREKVLHITTFMAMRSMRAIFCRTLRQKIVLLAVPNVLTSTMALQSRLESR